MRIKQEHKVIILAVAGGVFLWLMDAILDKFDKFPNEPFLKVLLLDAPSHEFWIRPIFVLSFTIFGLLIAFYMQKGRFSEGRYRHLFASINDIVLVKPFTQQIETEKFLEANPVASQKLGYTKEELLQLSVKDLVDPEKLYQLQEFTETLRACGHICFETALVTKAGEAIPAEVSSHVIKFNGKSSVLSIARDISERKKSEAEIRRLASFPQLNPNPVLEVDTTGAITFTNEACLETVKKLGETPEAFLPGDMADILQAAVQDGGGQFRREVEIKGAWFSEFIYFTPQFNVARIFPIEITGRRKAEECLRDSECQLRILTTRLLEVQEDERSRIAKEMHDELGQSLMLLKLQLSSVMDHLRKDQRKLRQECSFMLNDVDALIENIRRLITDLSPTVLEELGLAAAIKLLLEEFAKHYNIDASMVNFDDIDNLFPAPVRLGIYRIFQESLTNIGKHAKATRVSASIQKMGQQVSFLIKDNGQGFNLEGILGQENRTKGTGLSTMIERARLAGGQLDINSRVGAGTEIAFTIPARVEKETENGHL